MNNLIKIFWVEVLIFVTIVATITIEPLGERLMGLPFILIAGGLFCLLGLILTWETYHKRNKSLLDKFLLTCGISAAGILPAVVLHNLVYALLVLVFGKEVGDEPVFFLLGTVILPITFVVGTVGVLILLFKRRIK